MPGSKRLRSTMSTRAVKARAAADHTIAFYAPGYAAFLDDANRLGESELPLDPDTRALACAVSATGSPAPHAEAALHQAVHGRRCGLAGGTA